MILNGKCKEKFLRELYKEELKNNTDLYDLENIFDKVMETYQNALIIEFFDSVGIYILPIYEKYESLNIDTWSVWINDVLLIQFNSRQEATTQAIKKANDIYNNTDKV